MTIADSSQDAETSLQVRLRLALYIDNLGWGKIVLLALILATGVAWLRGIPYLQKQVYHLEEIQADLQLKRQQQKLVKKDSTLDVNTLRLNTFYEMLGEKKYVEQQVKTMLYLASESGVSLKAGEYQLAENNAGKFFTYRAQLPVKGSYQQIRKFVEQVLVTIPFSSLDEISFKREAISGGVIDSKIVFTLYVDAAANSPGGFQ